MAKLIIAIVVAMGFALGSVSLSSFTGVTDVTKDSVACKDKGSTKDTSEDKGKEA